MSIDNFKFNLRYSDAKFSFDDHIFLKNPVFKNKTVVIISFFVNILNLIQILNEEIVCHSFWRNINQIYYALLKVESEQSLIWSEKYHTWNNAQVWFNSMLADKSI